MKLIGMNWSPNDRQLRQFGLIAAVALPLIAWLWGGGSGWIVAGGAVGTALAAIGWLAPRALKPLFLGLSLVTLPIGLVVGELVLAAIYFGLFMPIAILFRLVGRDALERRIDRSATTYWQPKKRPAGPASYFNQW
ncbi:hypothetical protein Pan216_38700 [Planctomycetes bacterium Pan216]|uniref:SxtJ n=1 Tax=Kolteria novifilia TaxID=2527975 RepID=A0A518B7P4_9BACT|nr:hypothetical protein Pan216_38700 [Planctomycetes bacterium Pan216]